jgi:hypothetical protein
MTLDAEDATMADERRERAIQQADGQPENTEDLQGASDAGPASQGGREGRRDANLPESAMGGTSDAGTAADDAAEAATLRRGLPDDKTR